jgi:hypothetical protein
MRCLAPARIVGRTIPAADSRRDDIRDLAAMGAACWRIEEASEVSIRLRTSSPLVLILVMLMVVSSLAPVMARQSEIHGLDPTYLDRLVDPAVDFYRYANGGWLDRTTIPPDKGDYGAFTELEDLTRHQLRDLLTTAASSGTLQPGSDEEKAVRLYQQGTDQAGRNAQGFAPIQSTLDEIAAIHDLASLHRFLETSQCLTLQCV